jgi:hypothetical protein
MNELYREAPHESRLVHYIFHNPAELLTVFGMALILISMLGARRITIPVLRIGIEFQMEKHLRIVAFIVGCIGTGVGMWMFQTP